MKTKGVKNEQWEINTEANAYDNRGHPNEIPKELLTPKHDLSSFVLALKASIKKESNA